MLLHLAALLAPFAAAGLWCLRLVPVRGDFALAQFLLFGIVGALAANLAALLRWRALERRARAGEGAWITGIGMAAITHLLFGALFVVLIVAGVGGWRNAAGTGRPFDLVLQALFFFAISVFAAGIVTFPVTAWIAHAVAARRRRELAVAVRPAPPGGERGGDTPSGNRTP